MALLLLNQPHVLGQNAPEPAVGALLSMLCAMLGGGNERVDRIARGGKLAAMDFDLSNTACSILFGIIGIGLTRYGRATGDIQRVIIGVLLMVYSFFTPTTAWTVGVGAALCVAAYLW